MGYEERRTKEGRWVGQEFWIGWRKREREGKRRCVNQLAIRGTSMPSRARIRGRARAYLEGEDDAVRDSDECAKIVEGTRSQERRDCLPLTTSTSSSTPHPFRSRLVHTFQETPSHNPLLTSRRLSYRLTRRRPRVNIGFLLRSLLRSTSTILHICRHPRCSFSYFYPCSSVSSSPFFRQHLHLFLHPSLPVQLFSLRLIQMTRPCSSLL